MNLLLREKINPLNGSAGVYAAPMSARVSQMMAMNILTGIISPLRCQSGLIFFIHARPPVEEDRKERRETGLGPGSSL